MNCPNHRYICFLCVFSISCIIKQEDFLEWISNSMGNCNSKKKLSDRKTVMIKCLQKFQNVKSVLNCVYISLVFCYFKWGASLYPTLYLTHIVSLHPCFLDLPAWKYLLSLSFCFVLFDILLRYWLNLAFELQAQAVEAGGAVSNLGHSISILCWNHKSLKMKAKAKTHAYISWLVGCHILIQNRAVGGRGGG